MGNGMNKILPGLFVGNYRDSKDYQQLDKYNITHILAIHDSPRRLLPDKHYLCVIAADTPEQNLSQYFPVCNDFIHAARLRDGNVLIHCLAGMSRSVTVAVAYIMTVTNLNWRESLKVIRARRAVANPNAGFQTQLQDYEIYRLAEERRRLRERFPSTVLEQLDRAKCVAALECYEKLLKKMDICEGNCVLGKRCPAGVCNKERTRGTFRRRPSSAINRQNSSSLDTNSLKALSCPNSPSHSTNYVRHISAKNQTTTTTTTTTTPVTSLTTTSDDNNKTTELTEQIKSLSNIIVADLNEITNKTQQQQQETNNPTITTSNNTIITTTTTTTTSINNYIVEQQPKQQSPRLQQRLSPKLKRQHISQESINNQSLYSSNYDIETASAITATTIATTNRNNYSPRNIGSVQSLNTMYSAKNQCPVGLHSYTGTILSTVKESETHKSERNISTLGYQQQNSNLSQGHTSTTASGSPKNELRR